MYRLTVTTEQVAECETFPQAVREFMARIKETVDRGTSLQELETMHWIECFEKPSDPPFAILEFYDARDLAHDMGLMSDGKVLDQAPDLPEEDYRNRIKALCAEKIEAEQQALLLYIRSSLEEADEQLSELKKEHGDSPEIAALEEPIKETRKILNSQPL